MKSDNEEVSATIRNNENKRRAMEYAKQQAYI
jgi:hypothetical protein